MSRLTNMFTLFRKKSVEVVKPAPWVIIEPENGPEALRFQALIKTSLCGEGYMDVPVFQNTTTGMLTTWIGEIECSGFSPEGLGIDIAQKTDIVFEEATWVDTCIVKM